MKIRKSLKLYLMVVGVVSVLLLTVFSSSLSVHYFLLGMDTELRNTMTLAADIAKVRDGRPERYLGFYVASRWGDLPYSIRKSFDQAPEQEYLLERKLSRSSFLHQPESGSYALKVTNSDGETRYVAKYFPSFQPQRLCQQDHIDINQFALIGIAILLMFLGSLGAFLSVLIQPIEQFKQWAVALSMGEAVPTKTHFRFYELENVAQIIESNVREAEESLRNKKEFLDFTSHEMRTPLTVIRNNTEMLRFWDRLSPLKREEVVARLERGAMNLSNLTETMLWLSCANYSNLIQTDVNISALLKDVVEDNRYLLNGKFVEVDIHCDEYHCTTYPDALKIVLDNLVRNAFQHTPEGRVVIHQIENMITVKNLKAPEVNNSKSSGFGLGLKLIDRVIEFTQWELVNIENVDSRKSVLTLSFK